MMINGKISKIIKDRGFGFIGEGENKYFFHYSAIDPKSGLTFEALCEGDLVEFVGESVDKGLRAKPRTMRRYFPVNQTVQVNENATVN